MSPTGTSVEKKTQKQKNFLMTPYLVLDSDMHETSIVGFLRLMRKFGRSGCFVGSIRKLCQVLKMARGTVARMIGDWVTAGWVSKTARPRQEECGGEVMCLMLLTEDIWQANNSTDEPNQDLSQIGTGCPDLSQGVPDLSQGVPDLSQGVPTASTKVAPILEKDIDSDISPYMEEEYARGYGGDQTRSDSLPSPSGIETLSSETPFCWEAFYALGAHYLGTNKVSQQDAETLVQKTQSLASLVGPLVAYRQCITVLTFMRYCDHRSNWFRDKQSSVNLRNVATFYEDYISKCQAINWQAPPDKVPVWFDETEPPTQTQDSGAMNGMNRYDAEILMSQILAQAPRMETSYGALPGDRFTVGIRQNGTWIDFYGHDEWREWADRFLPSVPIESRESVEVTS